MNPAGNVGEGELGRVEKPYRKAVAWRTLLRQVERRLQLLQFRRHVFRCFPFRR